MPRTSAGGQKSKARSLGTTPGKQASQKGGKTSVTRGEKNRLTMVRSLIDKWSEQLGESATKSGVAELVRLLALEKELSASKESIREIKVSWVEPKATESSKSE
jgi:hypothetical protein